MKAKNAAYLSHRKTYDTSNIKITVNDTSTHTVNSAPQVLLPCGRESFVKWARKVYNRCQWCNCHFVHKDKKRKATCDHLVPKSRGGKNGAENLVLSCAKCNEEKGSKIVNKVKFYGPRWKKVEHKLMPPQGVNVEVCTDGQCVLWIKRGEKKWAIIFEGTWDKCYKRRQMIRKDCLGVKTEFMILPKGLMVRPEMREERLADIVRRTLEARELHERIALNAYHKWLNSGCQHGRDVEHWLEAESEEWDGMA